MEPVAIDDVLEIQLIVAWAGENVVDDGRLGWWRTTMGDPFGGEDLLQRLAPKTYEWAVLETIRAAATRVDARLREASDDADRLVTLFRFGFELDERLDDRLQELKRDRVPVADAFPQLAELCAGWSRERFAGWLDGMGKVAQQATATGRRIKDEAAGDPAGKARQLAAGLLPLADSYSMPHFRM